MKRDLTLILTEIGGVELVEGDDTIIWESVNDVEFQRDFGRLKFIDTSDVDDVMEFLVTHSKIKEDETDGIGIHEEILDQDEPDDEDEEEFEDEDEDETSF